MRDFWRPLQKVIEEVCINFDNRWQIRRRVIDSHFLVLFVFKLVSSKNQQGYKILLNELWERQELKEYQTRPVSSSSLCEARQKLSEEIFIELNRAVLLGYKEEVSVQSWRGHRVFAADGSKIHLPHELVFAGYKAPNRDQYYPQGLMSILYHLGNGLIYDCLLTSNKSERHCVLHHMDTLSQGDILILDRGYFSYLLLHQATEKNLHLICRLQSGGMNKAVREFWHSPHNDKVIDYYPSAAVKSEIKKQGYHLTYRKIKVRLVKYQIDNTIYVCATTLIGEQYPITDFPSLYHGRWGIEELYKISKEFVNVEDIHSKTERGVKQELYAHVLLINIARIFESEANNQLPLSPNSPPKDDNIKESYWQDFCGKVQKYKINFKNCLLVISRNIEKLILSFGQEIDNWLQKILDNITNIRQKIRPGRHYPRKSRKPYTKWKSSNLSKFTCKTP